jgi:hypothetical protein
MNSAILLVCRTVPTALLPTDYEAIDRLIETKDLEQARELLLAVEPNDLSYAVLHIKLALYDGSLEPMLAAQRLVQLMRKEPGLHGARDLYKTATELTYAQHESSLSRSHVPPPVKTNEQANPKVAGGRND